MSAPVPESRYHEVAKKRGVIFIGPYTGKGTEKVTWQCLKGHQWQATFNVINQRSACPRCFHESRRKPEQAYFELAERRGFLYIGGYTGRVIDCVDWQCEQGHQFRASYHKLNHGRGCPICSGQYRRTESDYHDLAKSRGFRFIGDLPAKVTTKTQWECAKGHTWPAPYSCIKGQETGCPICQRENNRGDTHPSWNPRLTDKERQERRHLFGYQDWVKDIKERDNWTCQICKNGSGLRLVAHHLNSYKDHPEQRFNLDNGVCLCQECHLRFHSIYGWKHTTVQQFIQFASHKINSGHVLLY